MYLVLGETEDDPKKMPDELAELRRALKERASGKLTIMDLLEIASIFPSMAKASATPHVGFFTRSTRNAFQWVAWWASHKDIVPLSRASLKEMLPESFVRDITKFCALWLLSVNPILKEYSDKEDHALFIHFAKWVLKNLVE